MTNDVSLVSVIEDTLRREDFQSRDKILAIYMQCTFTYEQLWLNNNQHWLAARQTTHNKKSFADLLRALSTYSCA